MLKWKTFIQGQGLNEELLSFTDRKILKTKPVTSKLDGNKVRQTYENIINEPSSTSITTSVVEPPNKKTKKFVKTIISKPKLTLLELMRFCESDEFEKLSEAIGDFDLNTTDEFGWTLLMCASCAGSNNCVELLLKSGANWTLRDKTGNTALNLAQKKRKNLVYDIITNWIHKSKTVKDEKLSLDGSEGTCESANSKFCQPCNSSYTSDRIHIKSIAHLVATSDHVHDKVHYGIPESNKGFQLMLKTGWDKQVGLGSEGQGQKFPVKTILKRDRKGLGNTTDKKAARITHFGPFDTAAIQNSNRHERLERSRTLKKKEDLNRRTKEQHKEIKYRRELSSL